MIKQWNMKKRYKITAKQKNKQLHYYQVGGVKKNKSKNNFIKFIRAEGNEELKGVVGLVKKRIRHHQEILQKSGSPGTAAKVGAVTSPQIARAKNSGVDSPGGVRNSPKAERGGAGGGRGGTLRSSQDRESPKSGNQTRQLRSPSVDAIGAGNKQVQERRAQAIQEGPKLGNLEEDLIKQLYEFVLPCIFLPLDHESTFFPQKLLENFREALNVSSSTHERLIIRVVPDCNFEVRPSPFPSPLRPPFPFHSLSLCFLRLSFLPFLPNFYFSAFAMRCGVFGAFD